ncbi:MAG: UDP-N-acetylmuramate dehydrogenase [Actinomycetota bacterium]
MAAPARPAIERAAADLGDRARRAAPLGALTTYRVGGEAALLVEAHALDDLRAVGVAVARHRLPVLVLGRGSNVLVADDGFAGVAVVLGEGFDAIEIDGTRVRAGGAVSLPVLARRSVAAGLTGLEWAVGVPGSVGGAVRMNAGGHGSDMAADLDEATVVDLTTGDVERWDLARLDLAYRSSALAGHHVVVEAAFALGVGPVDDGERTLSEIVRWRREHQPGGQNSGSVFTNPPGDSAGRLVDACGLKGHRIGTAEVSPKHANFFQADPGGRADDVVALVRDVRDRVEAETGVRLHPELRLVGYGSEVLEALDARAAGAMPRPSDGELGS